MKFAFQTILTLVLSLSGATANAEDKVLAAITTLHARASESGHVWRAPRQWAHFVSHQDMRKVFDGQFRDLAQRPKRIERLLTTYVVAYSNVCRQALPEEVAVYEIKQRVVRYAGFYFRRMIADYEVVVNRIFVHPALQDHYFSIVTAPATAQDERLPSWFMDMMNQRTATGVFEVFLETASPILSGVRDMEVFLGREGCVSPAQYQFQENLERLMEGDPSLQDEGIPVQGAAAASTPLAVAVRPDTFAEACVIEFDYRYDLYEYCACMERGAEARLTGSALSAIVADYSRAKAAPFRSACTK